MPKHQLKGYGICYLGKTCFEINKGRTNQKLTVSL